MTIFEHARSIIEHGIEVGNGAHEITKQLRASELLATDLQTIDAENEPAVTESSNEP